MAECLSKRLIIFLTAFALFVGHISARLVVGRVQYQVGSAVASKGSLYSKSGASSEASTINNGGASIASSCAGAGGSSPAYGGATAMISGRSSYSYANGIPYAALIMQGHQRRMNRIDRVWRH